MSYILKQIGDTPNTPYYEFDCDTLADIESISTSMLPMGSVANILEDGASIILNGDGEWRSAKTGNGILADVLEWDGDTEGRPFAIFNEAYFYWVSEHVPSIDDFENGVSVRERGSDDSFNSTYEDILDATNEFGAGKLIVFGGGAVAPEDNFTIEGVTFPKKGIYFVVNPEDPENNCIVYLQIPGYNKFLNTSVLKDEVDIGSGDSGGQKTYSVTVSNIYGCYSNVYVNGESTVVSSEFGPTTFDHIPENTCVTIMVGSDGPSVYHDGCLDLLYFGFLYDSNEERNYQVAVYSVSGSEPTGTISISLTN